MSIIGNIDPAISKYAEREYSLEPDLVNGWRASQKEFRKIPLRYSYPPVDRLVKEYTRFNESKHFRVVYLGPRFNNNLRAIKAYCQKEYDSMIKEACVYQEEGMPRYGYKKHKEKDVVSGPEQLQTRIFTGMNPTLFEENQLVFDSDFESGNLDMVMRISSVEYDLFMRVDSNTKGHTSWYFFKVKNTRRKTKIKFNLCNFHKKSTLYTKGMRSYVFSKKEARQWSQSNVQTKYAKRNLRYKQSEPHSKPLYCLTFEYEFLHDYDQVYFSYGIPYSYSYLLKFLDTLMDQPGNRQIIKYQKKYESLSGLSVPVLTITNPTMEGKKTVLVTGRLHPGQTQGSWVLQGFIKYLCSPQGSGLRDIAVFKIIPMVNVDGVVLGNFRTSLRGADLNRKFKVNPKSLLKNNQVAWIKNLAFQHNKTTHSYIDFHGHSTNKSAFIYGPEYPMNHEHYFNCRLLPKAISRQTEMFRYYSCNFRIPKNKETTARAIMFRENNIPFCFTIQTSNHSYCTQQSGEVRFNAQLFQKLGGIIAAKHEQFMGLLQEIDARKEEMKSVRQKRSNWSPIKKNNFLGKTKRHGSFSEISRQGSEEQEDANKRAIEEVYDKHNFSALKKVRRSTTRSQRLPNTYIRKQSHQTARVKLKTTLNKNYTSFQKDLLSTPKTKSPVKPIKQKRSTSHRLPPQEIHSRLNSTRHFQQYKVSPKLIVIQNHSSGVGMNDMSQEKLVTRGQGFKPRELVRREKGRVSRLPQKEAEFQPQISKQLCPQNIWQVKGKVHRIQERTSQCFIYKHIKSIVLPELSRAQPPSKYFKGFPRRVDNTKEPDMNLGSQLICRRNRSLQISRNQIQPE